MSNTTMTESLILNVPSLVAALKACIRLKDLKTGRRIHSNIVQCKGADLHIFVANTLIDMYSKCSSMVDARQIFDSLRTSRTLVTWNVLLMGYVINGEAEKTIEMFSRMRLEGLVPDGRTYNTVLKALASLLDSSSEQKSWFLDKVTEIHRAVTKTGFDHDIFVASTLVRLYAKCGSLVEATNVFGGMAQHDTVSWTALITGYVQAGENEVALELFVRMLEEGLNSPDCQMYAAVFKACGNLASREGILEGEKLIYLEKGLAIHAELERNGGPKDMFLESSLVDMYAKCSCMMDAENVFKKMERKDVVVWNSMITGYAQDGDTENALELVEVMYALENVKPDARTFIAAFKACGNHRSIDEDEEIRKWCLEKGRALHGSKVVGSGYESMTWLLSSLVDMYGKCKSSEDAKQVFDNIQNRDVVSWNAIISACANCGESKLAFLFYSRMVEEDQLAPDDGTFVAVLKACSGSASLEAVMKVHSDIVRYAAEGEVLVMTYLVEFYGKCSNLIRAQCFFDSVRVESKNVLVWNSLLAGYARHGDHQRVFQVVEMMRSGGVELNSISYLYILNACSHAGLVEKGKQYFKRIKGRASVEHYACMVDLLGRVNQIDDALVLVDEMKDEADKMIWMTVLSWCEKWKNVEYGRVAFHKLLELGSDISAAYVLMANMYS